MYNSAPTAKRSGSSLASSTTNAPFSPCRLPTRPSVTPSDRTRLEELRLLGTRSRRPLGREAVLYQSVQPTFRSSTHTPAPAASDADVVTLLRGFATSQGLGATDVE